MPGDSLTLGLAGDTMLGRGVAEVLSDRPPESLFSDEVVEAAREADLFVLNLECCISERGERWREPGKPFFFRAPPVAVRALTHLGVDCVTLANNHALDYSVDALKDTLAHLDDAGIAHVGAGADIETARNPAILEAGRVRVVVIGVTDHPSDMAAAEDRPGVAFAPLRDGVPPWLTDLVRAHHEDVVVATPHWGPNMNPEPLDYVRAAADELVAAGATLIAGHSAHVFQGVRPPVLFDLGDFVDDYAVDPVLRNDLGLLFLVRFDGRRPARLEVVPLALDYCHTRVADAEERDWMRTRFTAACASLGTEVREEEGRLVVDL